MENQKSGQDQNRQSDRQGGQGGQGGRQGGSDRDRGGSTEKSR